MQRALRKRRLEIACDVKNGFWAGFYDGLPYWLRNTVEFVERLIAYVTLLWRDRDFDQYYLYAMMELKLGRMQRAHERDSYHTNAPRYAHQIKICRLLLQRLMKDEYATHLFDEIDQTFGAIEFKLGGKTTGKYGTSYSTVVYRANVKTEQDEKRCERMFKNAIAHENYMRQRDREALFSMMKKFSEHWWC